MERQGAVPKTPGKQNQKRPVVSIRPIATIDSDTRVSRAIDILLKAAAAGMIPTVKDNAKPNRESSRGSNENVS